MEDEDPIVYIPIRRSSLLRLAAYAAPSPVPKHVAEHPDWQELCYNLTMLAEDLLDPKAGSIDYRDPHSLSPSQLSSPTLFASSSRACSLAPSDDLPIDDLDLDVPLDVGNDLKKLDLGRMDLPWMVEIDNHPYMSELQKKQVKTARLRGGWGEPDCIHSGDRVRLPRVLLRRETHQGVPMLDGPNGPASEEEDYGRFAGSYDTRELQETNGGDGGIDAQGNSGLGDSGESEMNHPAPCKKRKRCNNNHDFITVVRKKRTRKEATSLIAAFSAISTQHHFKELNDLIQSICSSASQQHELSEANPHIIFALTRQYEHIAMETKVFEFQRLILLMQISICVAWYVMFHTLSLQLLIFLGKCGLTSMAHINHYQLCIVSLGCRNHTRPFELILHLVHACFSW